MSHDAKGNKIFLGFLVVADSMINDTSLKIVFTDFGLHLDELVEADHAVDIITRFLVALGFEVNKSRQVFLLEFVHAVLC